MTEPRFSNQETQARAREMARGRCSAVSERAGVRMLWFPVINGRRVPCAGEPFETKAGAKAAAVDFQSRLRDELGETE